MFESPNQNYQCFLISRMCYWDVLVECSVLLKMTAQKSALTGTSSQEETNFLILDLRKASLWEQILLVTVWIPQPALQRRQSSSTAPWAVLSNSASFAWEDWLWSYHSQDLTLHGWSHSCRMNSAALQVTSLFIFTFIFRVQQPVISLLHSLRYLVSISVRMCSGLTSVCVLGTSIQFFQRGWQVKELWRSVLKVRRSSQELSSTTYFSAGAEYLHFSGFFSFFFFLLFF